MRLKEDKSNWRASNVLRKIAEIPEQPITRRKKSTRKWCKGKVGVLHNYMVVERYKSRWWSYIKSKCTNCGKEIIS